MLTCFVGVLLKAVSASDGTTAINRNFWNLLDVIGGGFATGNGGRRTGIVKEGEGDER